MEDRQITITCPHCGFSKGVPPAAIPEGTARVSCPRCREKFPFSAAGLTEAGAQSPPVSPPRPAPAGSGADPAAAAGPAPAGRAEPRTLAFSFRGSAGEYFGIWIVNTLLKLVTLGIYSAWAKVRQRTYFYGSTTLHGEPFAYLADPLTIFKGWLIGAAAFLLYMTASRVSALLSGIIGLAIFLAVPWLVVRSRMFNARNSAHRNIRFSFRPGYREAYIVFAGLPLLTPFTLGLLLPYVIYRQKRFLVEQSCYGMTPFSFGATAGEFYRLYLRVAFGALALLAGYLGLFALATGGSLVTEGLGKGAQSALAFLPLMFLFPLLYFYMATYVQTSLANLAWNATTLGPCRFRSALRTRDMMWLYLSNAVAIACTLGLLIPWATVRMARYRFQKLTVEASGGLDGFLALARRQEVGATGEEIGDILGIDVDFGF
ncbi:MAG: DUF898 family protein [Geobacteraceae bacterium]|nr:DUF898 family protein [Geobacteraceae bacterium]